MSEPISPKSDARDAKPALYRYRSKNNISLDGLVITVLMRHCVDGESSTTPLATPIAPVTPTFPPSLQFPVSPKASDSKSLLWELMDEHIPADVKTVQRQFSDHLEYTLARDRSSADKFGAFQATAYSLRDRLIEFWNDTNFRLSEENPKQIYYLSIEFLLGRLLLNATYNMDLTGVYKTALSQVGYHLEELYDQEMDAGLGNGGLGRLAACYLDSFATCHLPAWGYGLRYTYGMFKQQVFQGWQAEIPDLWLKEGNPWEITRFDVKYPVRFYGTLNGNVWEGGETVIALAHDTPIPGFRTNHTLNLRLWSSEPSSEFDLSAFNDGNYYKALERKQSAETIASVLYPNDSSPEGKALRLKQQYFFSSATLQDIIRRFKKRGNKDWKLFPEKVNIQLNDTHPTIAIPELIRLLVDYEGVEWDTAIDICRQTFAYTNHTVLPEALEKWSVPLLTQVLPRIMQIIFDINLRFMNEIQQKYGPDMALMNRLSIIEESNPKMVRMAHLGIVMSHHVNGVADIHSNILKQSLFKEFDLFYPGKFLNITNGVTPRRWLHQCNPGLTKLIAKKLGSDHFLLNLAELKQLNQFSDDKEFQKQWMEVKLQTKKRLARYLNEHHHVTVDAHALFDIHIKRIHEYKRQLLNILRVIHLYKDLQRRVQTLDYDGLVPKVIIFAGKAAPGYHRAKLIIKLINSVAERVNNDISLKGLLCVVFVPNYNVSLAELIVPASDISEHISTAGLEASGTSNMKFALNGGLIIGTMDGANIEIRDAIGHQNMFTFGLTADKVAEVRAANAVKHQIEDPRMTIAVNAIRSGEFGDPAIFYELVDSLIPSRDYYLLGNDFGSYLDAHAQVDKTFKDKSKWAKMSISSTAGMGYFTSDRAVSEYAEKVWGVKPLPPVSHESLHP